jgi:hypothetical protein
MRTDQEVVGSYLLSTRSESSYQVPGPARVSRVEPPAAPLTPGDDSKIAAALADVVLEVGRKRPLPLTVV